MHTCKQTKYLHTGMPEADSASCLHAWIIHRHGLSHGANDSQASLIETARAYAKCCACSRWLLAKVIAHITWHSRLSIDPRKRCHDKCWVSEHCWACYSEGAVDCAYVASYRHAAYPSRVIRAGVIGHRISLYKSKTDSEPSHSYTGSCMNSRSTTQKMKGLKRYRSQSIKGIKECHHQDTLNWAFSFWNLYDWPNKPSRLKKHLIENVCVAG